MKNCRSYARVDMQAHLQISRGEAAPSKAAMQLLDVSLKTAAVPGGTAAAVHLLEGIAAAGGVAAYLNACLAVTLSYGSPDARQQGLAWITGLQLDDAPLPALTEAISQVCILMLSMAHNDFYHRPCEDTAW